MSRWAPHPESVSDEDQLYLWSPHYDTRLFSHQRDPILEPELW